MDSETPATIRQACAADIKAMYETCRLAIREGAQPCYSAAQTEAWARRITQKSLEDRMKQLQFVVACDDRGEVVGFAALNAGAREMDYLYVHPNDQRRGVGRQLCESIEWVAQQCRFRSLRLVASLNALPFYERLGYVAKREISRDLEGIQVPCVLMEKRLQPPGYP